DRRPAPAHADRGRAAGRPVRSVPAELHQPGADAGAGRAAVDLDAVAGSLLTHRTGLCVNLTTG
ncbi:MAG: hypothetical protein L0I24_15890, partial [Pseudonocardia sp.]|nr:hypothetical protein [Pseudonocardia sp.]